MKYIIFDITSSLAKNVLGVAHVTTNPVLILSKEKHTNFALYQAEEELPEGLFNAKISDGKITLSTGKVFGVKMLQFPHYICFEPDATFKVFGTGYVKELKFENMPTEGLKSGAFLIASEKVGPKEWTRACLSENSLDCGQVLDVVVLKEELK